MHIFSEEQNVSTIKNQSEIHLKVDNHDKKVRQ